MRCPGQTSLLIAALLISLALAGTGCAGTLTGQVLDGQAGKPIAGAVVLGVWTKYVGPPGLESGQLVGVKETETGADGRFTLERPGAGWAEEAITVYKFGHVAWSNLFIFPTSERRPSARVPDQIPLERFPPGQSHQRHMMFINNATAAGMYGRESIPKFRNALRPELEMR